MDGNRSGHLRLLSMCDGQFLPQVLVLHASLCEAAGRDVELDVLALEPGVARYLEDRGPASIRVTRLEELEALDPELRATREERSWVEYCWTVTPAFCAHMVETAPSGAVVVWLDADIAFLRNPAELLEPLGAGSVLLVPHSYYQPYPYSARVSYLTENWGTYNGGTIAFRHDDAGLEAVRRWRSMSIEWCFDRVESGRFGNQKHLTNFASRYAGVRVMPLPGGSLGPWNAGQFALERGADGGVLADGQPVLSYHYQSLRLYRLPWWLRPVPRPLSLMRLPVPSSGLVARTTPWYRLRSPERRLFWQPYLQSLAAALDEVHRAGDILVELETLRPADLAHDLRHKARLTFGRIRHRIVRVSRRIRPRPARVSSGQVELRPERHSPP